MRYLFIILLFSSCSATNLLKRADRLIKKAESKGAVWSADTVFKIISVPISEVQTDTVFKSLPRDTVRISKDKLKIKYVKLPGDSVFIEGKCEADTVFVKVPVGVKKKIEAGYALWQLICSGVFGIILSFILYRLLIK